MKLYYAKGACSLSPHIVANEAGLDLRLEKVDLRTKRTSTGEDFETVNPKGYVPVLELDDGRKLTEGPAIVQFLADQKPDSELAPAPGTYERAQLQEWLNFIGTEIHKAFSPLFRKDTPDQVRAESIAKLGKRLAWVTQALGPRSYLMGEKFTAADAYLFTVLRWAAGMKIQLDPALEAYQQRVAARPAVKKALEAEELPTG